MRLYRYNSVPYPLIFGSHCTYYPALKESCFDLIPLLDLCSMREGSAIEIGDAKPSFQQKCGISHLYHPAEMRQAGILFFQKMLAEQVQPLYQYLDTVAFILQ